MKNQNAVEAFVLEIGYIHPWICEVIIGGVAIHLINRCILNYNNSNNYQNLEDILLFWSILYS